MTIPQRRYWIAATASLCAVAALVVFRAADGAYSNIEPDDYVGPDACRECHEDSHRDNYESWRGHAHRVMNQNPSEETVRGDFSGVTLRYAGGHAVFHRDGDDYLMSIYRGDQLLRRHVVTRTVGSLYVQYYIGRQVVGPEGPRHVSYKGESKLPFGYSITLQRWLPEIYFDSTVPAERTFLRVGSRSDYIYTHPPTHNWNVSCLTCHNTYPYVARLWEQADTPREQAPWKAGFPQAAVDWRGEARHQGRIQIGPVRGLSGDELVTVGISCESCHFGGREHAVEEREIRFVPTSPELTIRNPATGQLVESDRKDPFVVNSICAQCHNAQLNRYPDGSPAVNSNEATALLGGACRSAIKCTDCHNPHEAGPRSGTADPTPHVEACLSCHPQFVDPAASARHSRHSAAVSCLDCHMPRTVAGLDTIVRSHQISKPSDERMLSRRAPNACNLCHLDRPITWTIDELAKGWGYRAPSPDTLQSWYGRKLHQPMGEVWLDSRTPFVRAAAIEAYAGSPLVDSRAEYVLEGLDDSHAFNRTLALIALERVVGRRLAEGDYDLVGTEDERSRQLVELTRSLGSARAALDPGAQRLELVVGQRRAPVH